MELSLYGLLYLARDQSSSIMDIYAETYEQKRKFYLKSAVNLSRSLQKRGVSFTLVTNNRQEIEDDLDQLGYSDFLKVECIDFQTTVPDGLFYYSTHFKLDVFHYFASLKNEQYVGLVDLDMIAVNDVPTCLRNLAQAGIPLCYDVSDQLIPAFGHDLILRDMQRLSPDICAGRWYGGELIFGPPSFFAALSDRAVPIYERYVQLVDELFHKGDEMITSVALEQLQRDGIYVADAGSLGIVGRFFSVPTVKHPQKSFKYFENCFLLHLPVDKDFLAKVEPEQAENRETFLKQYKSYLSTIWIVKGLQKVNRLYRASYNSKLQQRSKNLVRQIPN
ncbi:hypothetical protein [Leptolyngbya sp. 7M]|uniref:hypothetical protein n=1 Tax=Leptolyngbya sp. 7M TaxID=2812896 RepID=UPI001B8CCF32|nr:hypothetical protein [Leptolyngbya sp. 7M]QYO67291.1 hypothetical protein JVX88_11065 [Leptolyngbya sp. 7M]